MLFILPILLTAVNINPSLNVPLLRKDGKAFGSSVALTQKTLLTALHVPSGEEDVFAVCGDKKIKTAILRADEPDDLAVLELETPCPSFIAVKIATQMPAIGDPIYSLGCPHGMCSLLSAGIVSGYSPPEPTRSGRLISDVQVWFGSSGGPLFNADGELIGITSELYTVNEANAIDEASIQIRIQSWSLFSTLDEIVIFLNKK